MLNWHNHTVFTPMPNCSCLLWAAYDEGFTPKGSPCAACDIFRLIVRNFIKIFGKITSPCMSLPAGPNLCTMIRPPLSDEPIRDQSIRNLKMSQILLERDGKCRGCNRPQSNFRCQTVLNFHDGKIYFSVFVHRSISWLPLCWRQATCQSYPTLPSQIPRISCKILLPCGKISSISRPYPSRRPNVPIFECPQCSCPP